MDWRTDSELMVAIRLDNAALEELYRRHRAAVLGFAARRARTPDEVVDLVGAVWLEIIASLDRFDPSRGEALQGLVRLRVDSFGAASHTRLTQTSIESSHPVALAQISLRAVEPVSRGRRARRVLLIALVIALPWLWFVARDAGGPLDTVAVGLPLIAIAAIALGPIAALISRRAWPLIVGASIVAVCAVSVIEPRLSRSIVPPDPAIRLVVANVWGENPTPDAVPESMTGRGADVLVAIEVWDDELFAALAEGAAAQGLDSTVGQGRQGVWSRFPVQVLDELGLPSARTLRVGVDVPGSPFVLYVVHGLNPLGETSFDDQLRFTEDLLTAIETEERPVVVAGDLNMSDRVVSYRKMDAALTDAMRAGAPGSTTYVGGWWPTLLLRIDHVFVTPSWCATRPVTFTPAGSDHRGVDVAVGPCD